MSAPLSALQVIASIIQDDWVQNEAYPTRTGRIFEAQLTPRDGPAVVFGGFSIPRSPQLLVEPVEIDRRAAAGGLVEQRSASQPQLCGVDHLIIDDGRKPAAE